MDFINDIKNETIIICKSSFKKYFFKLKKLVSVKLMSVSEFKEKFYFSYSEDAILYVMDKYNVKYDVALVYIDNLYYIDNNHTYVSLIDYKTGNDDISLKYLNYGLNMQLPIYLYLSNYLNLRNVLYSGFYLQKFNITENDYRLVGYSNSDMDILSVLDSGYDNSKIIKGMKTVKDGSFSKNSKVLSNEEIDKIKDIARDKIEEVINNIRNNKFDINPKVDGDKNIGCDFCKFRDICFVKKKNEVEINAEEFGGVENGMDE